MLILLVFLILLVLIAPALTRLAGVLFLLWLCVTYWYIGIPLTALWLYSKRA